MNVRRRFRRKVSLIRGLIWFLFCVKANFGSYDVESDVNLLMDDLGSGQALPKGGPEEWLKLLRKQQVSWITALPPCSS